MIREETPGSDNDSDKDEAASQSVTDSPPAAAAAEYVDRYDVHDDDDDAGEFEILQTVCLLSLAFQQR